MRILLMYEPNARHFEALKKAAPFAHFDIAKDEPMAQKSIEDADVVLGNRYFVQSLPFAKKLKWMQSNSAGLDPILISPHAHAPFLLTSSRGVYDEEVAEHALALILSLARKLHLFRDEQKRGMWNRVSLKQIAHCRCLILGYGSIGRAIGKKLLALGAHVEGVGKNTPPTWKESLPKLDFLIVSLPLTPLTRNLVESSILKQLPPHAHLINVGRGETVDEIALLHQIQTGALAGAALDVFENEPLFPSHPFWKEEKIVITPHNARSPEEKGPLSEALFEENLCRFYSGKPLLNLVNKSAGY